MKPISIITRINLAMAAIIFMSISTILVSYWLSDQADNDAYAINMSGSMRMHSYRMALDDSVEQSHKADVENIFQDPIVYSVAYNAGLTEDLKDLEKQWQQIEPNQLEQLDLFVHDLNTFVGRIQENAESNIRTLRTFQVIAFFITMVLSSIVIYWIHLRFTIPLKELTQNARQISRGDFTFNVIPAEGDDELSVLSRSLEHMCKAIAYMYESLENQVEEKTKELHNSNKTLTFLYDIARRISTHEISKEDFNSIIQELTSVIDIADIELCLLTESGDIPYMQINGNKERDCFGRDCRQCLMGAYDSEEHLHFTISRENHDYGVLVIHRVETPLPYWKHELLTSVSSLFAIALSLQQEEENIRRITLINERTIIARELHDSLAQALSYLKIQVTRLNRAIGNSNFEVMMDVSTELKQGLDSAYRHLRELLTTFRLKVDGQGLSDALAKTITQYKEQTDMAIGLDYQIINVPLSPQEEIHLLQIIRESCQNAINHSHGTDIQISMKKDSDNQVTLSIEDNGIGIDPNPEKLNHYGLAIVQERARQLGGHLDISRRDEGGTKVEFDFTPEYYAKK